MCDTLQEAHDTIKQEGGKFLKFSYFGGFPVYVKQAPTIRGGKVFTIQGAFMCKDGHIVCSLDAEEKNSFDFSN